MKIEVKNTNLLITDPCYIRGHTKKYLDESTIYGDWSCMCYRSGNVEEVTKKANEWSKYYFDFFHKYNFETISKDEKQKIWEDFKSKKDEFIEENCFGEFCADSGQVAVFDYNTLTEKDKEWVNSHPWCACVVPNYSGTFEYVLDENGNAHIVGDTFYTMQSGL